ncbi:DUF6340 family protein [Labilibaculum sp.]|uniref:DUF6340 family protein n=1 Tax=Labilibaculum sp. TaxID=2060723 RepID=UPI00356B2BAE
MKIYLRLIIPIFGILFSSCQTLLLYEFQGLNAPNVIVPSDVKTMAFVDRNLSFKSDTMSQYYLVNDVVVKDTMNYSAITSYNCYKGFSENLSEYFAMDSLTYIQLSENEMAGNRKYTPMPWEQVDSICSSTGSDVVVCLEDILLYSKYTVFEDILHYGITDVNYLAVWRIYDPLTKTYLDEKLLIDSVYSEVSSTSYKELVDNTLPKRKDVFTDVSYEIGNQYAISLAPEWIDLSRFLFSSGDDRLSISQYYLDQNNWETPINLWTEMTSEKNLKLAARACYNLAVAYEIKDDFVQANKWLQESIKNYYSLTKLPAEYEKIEKYSLELQVRTKNKEKLDLFFGE